MYLKNKHGGAKNSLTIVLTLAIVFSSSKLRKRVVLRF
jgi:hypothetical protein